MEERDIPTRVEEKNKGFFEFLIDLNKDRKKGNIIFVVLVFVLIGLVVGMAIGMFFMGIHCQNKISEQADRSEQRMYEFISQYDFPGDVELDTGTIFNSESSGNINVTR